MSNELLVINDLFLRYGGLVATDHLSLSIRKGELHAIIGPNGAGKTTLLSQLSGELRPNAGQIWLAGEDITSLGLAERSHKGIARSFQITSILTECTACENVAVAVQAHQGHSFKFWRNAGKDRSLRDPAYELLRRVGLADAADVLAANLAHGARRQLELAMALASQPACLLLDEPMAGMSAMESIEMTKLLQELKREHTILLVEHDMTAVFALADRISVLVYGKLIASGTADEIRANPAVQKAYLGEEAL